jgi:acyl-CoA reductase-like NAD-dependent aldehyde dehydrogenase
LPLDESPQLPVESGRPAVESGRLPVLKTYKLYLGGAFPRSESGRSYVVSAADGRFLANAAQASRKDARDAVVAARKAFPAWAAITAYNRGQILYRVAELMEGRRAEFSSSVVASEGLDSPAAEALVGQAIDRWIWYAGWTDKIAQVLGGANPVAGPYFDFSIPEPTGVVAVIAPQVSSLLGLVSVLAPVMATGCTAVVVASEGRPLPAVTLSEVLATSDVPGGVVNILTGRLAELAPVLAAHMDVNALDVTGVAAAGVADLQRLAAENVKRVFWPAPAGPAGPGAGGPGGEGPAAPDSGEPDWSADPGLDRIRAFVETKTVWHPMGV